MIPLLGDAPSLSKFVTCHLNEPIRTAQWASLPLTRKSLRFTPNILRLTVITFLALKVRGVKNGFMTRSVRLMASFA
jgi:hypothetical protein